jgi:hypothetical protein
MKVSIKTLKGSSFEIEVDPSSKVRRAAALFPPHPDLAWLCAERNLLVAGAAS